LAIRLWTGIKKTNSVVLPTSTLQGMGIDRHAAARTVKALEKAGLLAVTRRPGRKSIARVIEIDEAGGPEASSR
jgi:DNA-binding MarR family transcriptional regulator